MFNYKCIINKCQWFHQKLNSPEIKTLLSNFSWLSLLQIASYAFPFITTPYLARVIGVEGVGKVAFALAVIVWFNTIADWGFNYSGTRDIAKNKNDIRKISVIYSNVMWAKFFLLFVSFISLCVLIIVVPKFYENAKLLLVTFIMIPGEILFPSWLFQGLERMKESSILNIISKLIFTILVFIFVKNEDDYIIQPILYSLGFIISGIIAQYIIFKWNIRILRPNIKLIKNTIKSSTDIFLNNILHNLYNSFSTILLGFYHGGVSNGYLDASRKFIGLGNSFMQVIQRTCFPFLSRRIDKHYMYAYISIPLSILAAIVLYIFAPWLITTFYSQDFIPSVSILRILSVSIIFGSLYGVYGTNYLIIQRKEKVLRNITLISSLIGFIISFPLIFKFDYIGAALTITSVNIIMGLWSYFSAVKVRKQKD